ncbi:MAG: hypothetical protein Q8N99_03630 [Nanoarchaeota archaeon]|nr:hypothetical protein [Nanoarchaeota archaeon]
MESFIKKVFEGINDEYVHIQFQKFSRGEFKNRAMIRLKNSNGKYTLNTTSEYARELVRAMGDKLGNSKTHVTGTLISALEISGIRYEGKSNAMGIKKYRIDREMTGIEIVEICDTQTKAFIGLSFKAGEDELKVQAKSPKSSKGAASNKKEDVELKINFCKLKTTDKNLIEKFIFDNEDKGAKKIEIKHDFLIKDIIVPQEYKNEKDFAIIREKALRKGIIIRYLNIDGKEIKKEIEFEA